MDVAVNHRKIAAGSPLRHVGGVAIGVLFRPRRSRFDRGGIAGSPASARSREPRAVTFEPFSLSRSADRCVGAIQLCIVGQLSRLHEAGVVPLRRAIAVAPPMSLQQLTTALCQRHEGRSVSTDDVGPCLDETCLAEAGLNSPLLGVRGVRADREGRRPQRPGMRQPSPASGLRTHADRSERSRSLTGLRVEPRGRSRSRVSASLRFGSRDAPSSDRPTLARLRSGRSRSSSRGSMSRHMTWFLYALKSSWRSLSTASRDPSCWSMCESFRPASRRNSQRAMS